MSVATVTGTARGDTTTAGELQHVADSCCAPFRRTLCGREITPEMEQRDEDATCIVCAELEQRPTMCSNCGDLCGGWA